MRDLPFPQETSLSLSVKSLSVERGWLFQSPPSLSLVERRRKHDRNHGFFFFGKLFIRHFYPDWISDFPPSPEFETTV